VNAATATGTFTLDTVIATDAVVVNGVTLTAIASGANAAQFNVGADDDETAANLAATINASEDLATICTATSAAAVVTVSAAFPGTLGNAITIASNDATITASGARLEGGDNGALTRDLYFGSAS
jgi:phage tail sheath gpL-like